MYQFVLCYVGNYINLCQYGGGFFLVFYVETMMIIILGVTSIKVVLLNCCQLQVDLENYVNGGIWFAATMLAGTNVVEEK